MLFWFRSHTREKNDVFTHVTNRYITENFCEGAVTLERLFGVKYYTINSKGHVRFCYEKQKRNNVLPRIFPYEIKPFFLLQMVLLWKVTSILKSDFVT